MISPQSVELSTKKSIRRFSLSPKSQKTKVMTSEPSKSVPQAKPESLYFAYGSNLQLAQMRKRCPESRYLGVAYLRGYKFQINQRGYANVVPSQDDVVAGLCYLLSAEDERRLDVNEGVAFGAYQKEILDVELFLAKAVVVGRKVSEIIEFGFVGVAMDGRREGAPTVPDPLTRDDQTLPGHPDSVSQDMVNELGLEPSAPVSDPHPLATGQQVHISDQQIIQSTSEVPPRGETLQALVYVSRQYTTESTPREEYVDRMNLGITDALKLGVSEEHMQKYIRKYIPLR
jgi:gamma-glutamylcyclotransferase